MSALLEAEHLAFSYGERVVLADVSLRLERGRVVALLGPNGCGKSTLLRILLGMVRPAAGRVELDGRRLERLTAAETARIAAYVPQQTVSPFPFTALQLVMMARTGRHPFSLGDSRTDRVLARRALERLGAGRLAGRTFSSLSGGERQLVVLARALAQESPLLLMDEPVTALDYGHQLRLLDLLVALAREDGRTVLFTTHNPEHALAVADEVRLLRSGQMRECGEPAAVLSAEVLGALYGLAPERLVDFWRRSALLDNKNAEMEVR